MHRHQDQDELATQLHCGSTKNNCSLVYVRVLILGSSDGEVYVFEKRREERQRTSYAKKEKKKNKTFFSGLEEDANGGAANKRAVPAVRACALRH